MQVCKYFSMNVIPRNIQFKLNVKCHFVKLIYLECDWSFGAVEADGHDGIF